MISTTIGSPLTATVINHLLGSPHKTSRLLLLRVSSVTRLQLSKYTYNTYSYITVYHVTYHLRESVTLVTLSNKRLKVFMNDILPNIVNSLGEFVSCVMQFETELEQMLSYNMFFVTVFGMGNST